MIKEREKYLNIVRELEGDAEGRRIASRHIEDSDCYIYGKPAPVAFVPEFYTEEELDFFSGVCSQTHTILCKVIQHYIDDPGYRRLFDFSEEEERLILMPCGYSELLPIARFDFFLNEEDRTYKFCEFNADGAAAMSRTAIGCEAVMLTDSYRKFSQDCSNEPFEYFDSWAEEFMRTYRSDRKAKESPNILITDFTENLTMSDVTRFLASFEKMGLTARYVDIRKLAYDDRGLYDPEDGLVFDAIYRRAVTSDVVAHMDECRNLVQAVEDEKVCMIGHFRTTVIHSKMINVALLSEQTRDILTPSEWEFVQAHTIPTYQLKSSVLGSDGALDLDDILRNKDSWIIKPQNDYDSHGVFAGKDLTSEEWADVIEKYTDASYIIMPFYTPQAYSTVPVPMFTRDTADAPAEGENPDSSASDYGIEPWYSMTGIYSYNGRHYGFFSRMGREGVISESHGGVSVPSFRVK